MKNEILRVRLEQRLHEKLKNMVGKRGITISELVRDLISSYTGQLTTLENERLKKYPKTIDGITKRIKRLKDRKRIAERHTELMRRQCINLGLQISKEKQRLEALIDYGE